MTFSHSDSQGNSGNHHVENAEERRGVRKCIPFFGVLASWLINAYLAWIPEADVLADPSSVDCNQNLCTAACRLVNVKIGKPAPMEDGSLYYPRQGSCHDVSAPRDVLRGRISAGPHPAQLDRGVALPRGPGQRPHVSRARDGSQLQGTDLTKKGGRSEIRSSSWV